MVAALALYPLWGAALGLAGAEIFLYGARLDERAAALAAALLWMAAARAEGLVLGFARPWIPAIVLGAFWFQALRHLDMPRVLVTAVAAHAVSRAGAIGLAWVSRPAPLGPRISGMLGTPAAVAAVGQGVAAAFLTGARAGLLFLAAAYLLLRLMQTWSYKRCGGMDASGLAVSQTLLEFTALLVFAFLT